jgi:hypothetical protein
VHSLSLAVWAESAHIECPAAAAAAAAATAAVLSLLTNAECCCCAGEVLLNLLRAHTAAYKAIRALPNGREFKVRAGS